MLEKLYTYSKFGIRLGLENMKKILGYLGNPQNKYKTIHIAGTNGKGSVASMLESVLIEAGYRTGKYTSPHLVKLNERIVFNRQLISDIDLERLFQEVEEAVKFTNVEATFFEITTAIMFLYFAEKNADFVVLETGMGGRFDATNVVIPVASVITNISMDHMQFLGDTIEKIAYEKGGIIKDGVPLFYADRKQDVITLYRNMTPLINESLEKYHYELVPKDDMFITPVRVENMVYRLPFLGDFQAENFILAYDVLRYIGINKETIKSGIEKSRWEGRMERVWEKPLIILDGAHNEDSASKLKENVQKYFADKKTIIITSVLGDKDGGKVFKTFSAITEDVIFTSLENYDRGESSIKVMEKGKQWFRNYTAIDNICEALVYAFNKKYDLIIISGSLFLVGEFKKEIDEKWLKENLY